MAKERLVTAEAVDVQEERLHLSLRPKTLIEYIGQESLVEKLGIALRAAKQREEAMEHVLLHGPPGLGKTTLANVIANEMGTHLVTTSGPALTRPTDLVGTLTKLQPGDVLFIDEIHRLGAVVEEYIYPAMEDFKIDVTIDSGMHAKTITLPVAPFCLIGATTRAGLLSGPMRSRFGITHSLEFYTEADLLMILKRSAKLLEMAPPVGEVKGDDDGDDVWDRAGVLNAIASRSRGTPRIANRLLRRVRDFAQVRHDSLLSEAVVDEALRLEGVDGLGLDGLDRKYLGVIADVYEGGPVGLEAVAATMGEDTTTLEDMVEPFLLQIAFLARTRRGRQMTQRAAAHLGVELPTADERGVIFS